MTTISCFERNRRSNCLLGLIRMAVTTSVLVLFVAVDSNCQVSTRQTREQCHECCNKSGYDDYYAEQCRLKCFRNHDHCILDKGAKVDKPSPAKEEPPQPSVNREAVQQEPQPPRPAPPESRPRVEKPQLVWPNPLNLAPGREAEAAAHILALNGVPPQHPNYPMALRNIQDVLINFARNNPTGGALPTAQLERIIAQFK